MIQPTTQDEVMVAFVDRLHAKVTELNPQNCYLCDTPLPSWALAGDLIVTVAATSGQYDQLMFAGAGHATLAERTNILITPLIRANLDKPGEVTTRIVDKHRGVFGKWKGTLLRAILVEQIGNDRYIAWRPKAAGKEILREAITPLSATEPQIVEKRAREDETWLAMTITFGVMFDWRL